MDRSERIGAWISGIAHAGLIGWVAVAGALFRPLDAPSIRMTEVATMTETDFQAYAAASRGSGPLNGEDTQISALPAPSADSIESGAPRATVAPVMDDIAASPAPAAPETAPDLSDLAPQAPVSVATDLPQVTPPTETAETDPQIAAAPPAEPLRPDAGAATTTPDLPRADTGITAPETPRSALALDTSPRPQDRPGGLVAARNARLAAAAAAQQAAAEAQAQAQRQAAAQAQAATDAQQQAEAAARAEAAAQQQAAAQAQAEQDELAAAERQAEALAEAIAAQRNEQALAAIREDEARRQAEIDAAAARQAEQDAAAERQAEADRVEAARLAEAEVEAEVEAEREAQEEARQQAEADAAAETAAQASSQNGGLTAEQRAARDQAARDEQAVRDADAAAAVAAARTEPGGDELAMALDNALDVPGAGASDGPPLSLSEKDGFRLAIESCWNKGMLSVEAQRTTVTVRFSMTPDGHPEDATIRLIGQSGGGDAAAQQAFDIARRAILRCQGNGYPLPMNKYNRWKEVVIDFRPDGASVN